MSSQRQGEASHFARYRKQQLAGGSVLKNALAIINNLHCFCCQRRAKSANPVSVQDESSEPHIGSGSHRFRSACARHRPRHSGCLPVRDLRTSRCQPRRQARRQPDIILIENNYMNGGETSALDVLLNQTSSSSSFRLVQRLQVGKRLTSVAVEDFNRDGWPDRCRGCREWS